MNRSAKYWPSRSLSSAESDRDFGSFSDVDLKLILRISQAGFVECLFAYRQFGNLAFVAAREIRRREIIRLREGRPK